jgi:hypothetical protein
MQRGRYSPLAGTFQSFLNNQISAKKTGALEPIQKPNQTFYKKLKTIVKKLTQPIVRKTGTHLS